MTTAEGGMLLTNDENVAQRVRLMRSHGMTTLSYDRFNGHASSYDVVDLGYNYRLDDLRASVGLAQFERLPEMNERRRKLWDNYLEMLGALEGVTVPFGPAHVPGEWSVQPYILPVVLTFEQDRERIRRRLAENGIQTSVHYPPVHLFQLPLDPS